MQYLYVVFYIIRFCDNNNKLTMRKFVWSLYKLYSMVSYQEV